MSAEDVDAASVAVVICPAVLVKSALVRVTVVPSELR
jgi:hypothetical protein